MQRFLSTIIVLFICLSAIAQTRNSRIRGVVMENDSEPMMYASVALLVNGKIVTGSVTDTLGVFLLNETKAGNYTLRISSVGYNTITKEISVDGKKAIDLGRIVLSENTKALGEVQVVGAAATKNVTVEKTRINTSASMAAATGSLLDVIRSSSAVSVDGSDNVSIRGNSNVLILVDGVPTTLDGLSGIPAANVQSIDIVTSPDVKYDSEGTGGIISIVSKKQTASGLNAMASASYGFNGFFNGNAAINYNYGRFGVRMNYAATYEKDDIESELHRVIRQTAGGIDQQIDATHKNSNHNIGLNFNYKATSSDILTLDVKVGLPRMTNFQNFHNHYLTAGVEREKFRQTDITFDRTMLEGSLNYKHLFTPDKRELSIAASISSIKGNRPSYYYEKGMMVQRSVSGGHPLNGAFQFDYMTMPGKTKFEVGGKMTYRQSNIDHKMYERTTKTDEWTLSIPLSNDLKHREYIPAIYGMVSGKFSQRLTYKAGMRMEYSRVTLHSNKEQLDDKSDTWFVAPNLVLNYKVYDPFTLTFSLSRRISRPTYPQLNPYINLIDNQTYETGNVHLKPEKANKVDMGYTYISNILTLNGNAYFNYTQDYINQIAYLSSEALVMTYINGEMDVKTGLEQNVTIKSLRWMDIEIATNIYYTRSRGDFNGLAISNSGWVNNSNITLRMRPMKGLSVQAQYYVTMPQYFPQFTTKTIHYCDFGIKQTLLKGQLTLSSLLTDIFNTRRWDIHSDNMLYTLTNLSKNRTRIFWLSATWNFNSFKPMGGNKKKEEDRSVIRLGE